MKRETIWQIATAFDLKPVAIAAPQSGYRNHSYKITLANQEAVNLILFSDHFDRYEQIRLMHSFGTFLHQQGLPVRRPLQNRILRLRSQPRPAYAALYNYLPGSTISWEGYTKRHLKNLGKSMADFHSLAKSYPQCKQLPDAYEHHLSLIKQMNDYFAGGGVQRAMDQKLGISLNETSLQNFSDTLSKLQSVGRQQPLHLDFVRGNVLFDDNKNVSGIIDFEKAALGHPLLDLARTLAFLYVDCLYKTEDEVRAMFLEKGYLRRKLNRRKWPDGKVSSSPQLDALVAYFTFYDFYKFLLHNPYESLEQNQHYLRTRDTLLRLKILHSR